MITVELNKAKESVEIYLDEDGIDRLISALSKLKGREDHDHLFSESWAGHELDEQPQWAGNTVVHHLKIYSLKTRATTT